MTGTAQSCSGTGTGPMCRTGSAASARRAAVAAWPRVLPVSRCAYRSATYWAAVTTYTLYRMATTPGTPASATSAASDP